MASLAELLDDFAGTLATATLYPPKDYPAWSSMRFETHMGELRSLWADIRPRLAAVDAATIASVGQNLESAIAAFEAGDKLGGRKCILAIYNLDVKAFR